MPISFQRIVQVILEDYPLPWQGTHGVAHWARVLENGVRLAELTRANVDVVKLFAVFHDARRVNEVTDTGHGRRGAELAAELRGRLFDLPDEDFELLDLACADHTEGLIDGPITVQTCWDADRLDLGRVGMYPEPSKLCTEVARSPEIIKWADRRAGFEVLPDLVRTDWGIALEG